MRALIGICGSILLASSASWAQEAEPTTTEAAAEAGQPSQQPAAEPVRDPCEGVTCAGHGRCAVKGGDPACACDDGYVADPTTGLTCVESQPVVTAVLPAVASPPKPTEREEVELALRRNLGGQYAEFEAGGKEGRFADFMFEKFERKRNAGVGVLVPSLLLIVEGVACAATGFAIEERRRDDLSDELESQHPGTPEWQLDEWVNDQYEPTTKETTLIVVGMVSNLVGLTGMIVGSVLIGKARRGMHHLQLLHDAGAAQETGSYVVLTPLVAGAAGSATFGLDIGF